MPDEKYPQTPRGPDPVIATGYAEKERSELDVLREIFTYHAPSPYQHDHYEAIRASALSLAITIYNAVPKCADRTVAIRKVREAVMTANAAIALHGLV